MHPATESPERKIHPLVSTCSMSIVSLAGWWIMITVLSVELVILMLIPIPTKMPKRQNNWDNYPHINLSLRSVWKEISSETKKALIILLSDSQYFWKEGNCKIILSTLLGGKTFLSTSSSHTISWFCQFWSMWFETSL